MVPNSFASALLLKLVRQLLQQVGNGAAQSLDVFELISAGARAARIADLLFPRHDFEHVAWKLAACAPQVQG